ncbi:unnamed protein product [Phytophthora lilii]|uniref:RxLR effector protein n=1 Tax=Phytophthora lilii TaxID=2077276 RepID=A0A9W7D8K8_9STRA|nr:unnamed protein product [Phytophthora lilii]
MSTFAAGTAAVDQTNVEGLDIPDIANNNRFLRSQTITKADDGADEERASLTSLLSFKKTPSDFNYKKQDIDRMARDPAFAQMMFENWDKYTTEKVISKVEKKNGNILLEYLNRHSHALRDGTFHAN